MAPRNRTATDLRRFDLPDTKRVNRFIHAFDDWQVPSDMPRPRLFIPSSYRGTM